MGPLPVPSARRHIAAGTLTITSILTGVALAPAVAQTRGDTVPMTVVDRHLTYGQTLVVKGNLGADGAGRQVSLEYRQAGGEWAQVASQATGGDGRYRFKLPARRSGEVRVTAGGEARAAASSGATSSQSRTAGVAVAASIDPGARRLQVLAGRRAYVRGVLAPARPGRRVALQVARGGKWRTVDTDRINGSGRFSLAFKPRRTGIASVRVRFAGDGANARASVRPGRLRVFRTSYASWYGPGLYGNRTACGQTLGAGTPGVAHKTLPCGTRVSFRYRGRSVTVRVIDRGPYVGGREWDLTGATARRLGFSGHGQVWSSR